MMRVLHDMLPPAAERNGSKPAVWLKDRTLTYAEAYGQSRSLAMALWDLGLQKGDRAAFFLEKCFEKVVSIYGISMAGGVFVPIRKLSLGDQVAHIIADCGTRFLITTYNRLSIIGKFLDRIPSLEAIIAIGSPDDARGVDLGKIKVVDWAQALSSGAAFRPKVDRIIERDLAAILYTSGSTGKPKGVVLNHLNLMAGARSISEYLKIGPDDKLLSILTFGFDYGLNQLTTTFLHQAQIVLLEYLFPKDIVTHSRKHGITGIATVATTWIQLMQFPWGQEDIPTLRYITNSGGAIPEKYVLELKRRLPKTDIYLMYGLTEAFRSTFLDPALVEKHPTSMGKAVPGEEVIVVDDDGKPVKAGETGELVHRGVFVAQGYWNAPDLTAIRYKPNPLQPADVPLREMVVYSGDQVRIDEQGLLYFVGRKDEMIKSSGIRISPTEVEEVLYASGLLEGAVALGVPDETLGHVIHAVVAPAPGRELTLAQIEKYAKESLPPYMVPRKFEIRDSLPKNTNGKLDRALLKKEVYAALGLGGK